METRDDFGIYRSVKPENFFPNAAWQIDNTPDISDHEVLISVKTLNIDIQCFVQFMEASYGRTSEMSNQIMKLIDERGKLHNYITGTGGTLHGVVEKIGKNYGNRYDIKEGDEIVSLSSLTGIPLKLDKIIKIETDLAQLDVEGKAVLFENSPLFKITDILPLPIQLAAMEYSGEAKQTFDLVRPNDRVIILGATGKMGLLCAMAARSKLRNTGELIGDIDSDDVTVTDEIREIYDNMVSYEANNIISMKEMLENEKAFDVVINCSIRPLTEPVCAMLCKQGGSVFFANWGYDSKIAGFAIETLGKDIKMLYYRGFVMGQKDFLPKLVEEYPNFLDLYKTGLKNDFEYPWMNVLSAKKKVLSIVHGNLQEGTDFVFESPKSQDLLRMTLKVAKFDCNVLIYGETGTGKEIIGEILNNASNRKKYLFVKINCASIPENLLESELFGYEGGSFTGSNPKGKAGLWELADQGMIFLDEVGELPLNLQAKLLRAMEEKQIYRIGGERPIKADVRVISATNRDLYQMVKEKKFREDLYYRLNGFSINIPPLRERPEDIIPLIDICLNRLNQKYDTNKVINNDAKRYITSLAWNGNIRELENFIQKVYISSVDSTIMIHNVSKMASDNNLETVNFLDTGHPSGKSVLIKEGNGNHTLLDEKELYSLYRDKYPSTRKLAAALGVSQSTVVRKLRKYNL